MPNRTRNWIEDWMECEMESDMENQTASRRKNQPESQMKGHRNSQICGLINGQLPRLILLLAVLALQIGLTGCNRGDSAPAKVTDPLKDLVTSDLAEMRGAGSETARTYDVDHQNLFTTIFGGPGGINVRSYVDERIHYYLTPNDLASASISPQPVNTGFTTEVFTPEVMISDTPLAAMAFDRSPSTASRGRSAVVGAANLGVGLWLQGAVDRNVMTLHLPTIKTDVEVSTPRAGIMIIGPGYSATGKTESGKTFDFPSEYRQAILVHEARHSDCTGGVRQKDLDTARVARNSHQFASTFSAPSCGHTHAYCPSWHPFADLPACDRSPWGAYAVQYVFVDAVWGHGTGLHAKQLKRYLLDDTASRLLYITDPRDHTVSIDKLLNLEVGLPNMTSAGILD